jgi:hypothetical protein
LEVLRIIRLASGEVRKRGGTRSPGYHFGHAIPGMDALSAKTDGKASEFRYLLPQAKNAAREGEEKDAEIKDGVAADYTRANGLGEAQSALIESFIQRAVWTSLGQNYQKNGLLLEPQHLWWK